MTLNRRSAGWEALFQGKSKEQAAASMFNRWLWVTAKPDPDVGVDFIVEIPAGEAEAASFSLQIRSHGRKVRSEKIERSSALRIRRGVLPAFLISIDRSTGSARWIFLEPLFSNEASLIGGGALKVTLDDSQAFHIDASSPPQDLIDAIYRAKVRGALKAAGSLLAVADSMEERYRELDPRLIAEPSLHGKTQVITLSARDEPVPLALHLNLRSDEQRTAMMDAFDWGSPAHLGDAQLLMSGSPLIDEILDRKHLTNAQIVPHPIWEGRGLIRYSNEADSIQHEIVECRVSRGTRGAEILALSAHGLLCIVIRLDPSLSGDASLRVDYGLLRQWAADKLSSLPPTLRIINAARSGKEFELCLLDFPGDPSPFKFRWNSEYESEIKAIELALRAAAALSVVAKHGGWLIPGKPMGCCTPSQMQSWLAAESLLQGRRFNFPPMPFTLHFDEHPNWIEDDQPLTFKRQTELVIQVGSCRLGAIPVQEFFCNFSGTLIQLEQGKRWDIRCTPRDNAAIEWRLDDEKLAKF